MKLIIKVLFILMVVMLLITISRLIVELHNGQELSQTFWNIFILTGICQVDFGVVYLIDKLVNKD